MINAGGSLDILFPGAISNQLHLSSGILIIPLTHSPIFIFVLLATAANNNHHDNYIK